MVKGGCFKNPLYLIIGLLLVIIAMLIISNYTVNSQRKNIMEKFDTEQRCKDAEGDDEIKICKNIITEYNNCHAKNIKKEDCDDLKKECTNKDNHCKKLSEYIRGSPCHKLDSAINGDDLGGGLMCLFD